MSREDPLQQMIIKGSKGSVWRNPNCGGNVAVFNLACYEILLPHKTGSLNFEGSINLIAKISIGKYS